MRVTFLSIIIILFSIPVCADHYVRFNYISDKFISFSNLFKGGNDNTFYACYSSEDIVSNLLSKLEEIRTGSYNLSKSPSRCGSGLDEHFQEIIKYIKILTNEKKISTELYEKYKIISKKRSSTIGGFVNLLNPQTTKIEKIEKIDSKYNSICKDYTKIFNRVSSKCMEMDKEAIDVQKKLEQPIKSFDDIALKEELSADNNLLLEQNYNVTKKIIQNYISIIENTTNSVNLEIEEEKQKIKLAKEEKQRKEEKAKYISQLNSNFSKKSKLFGIQLLSDPDNYKIKKREVLKKDFAGGFYFENTTYDYYLRNYNVEVYDYIYAIEPPIINKSFFNYQIISREHNNIKIITDIIAKAKLINKGLDGCNEFFYPIKDALFRKYGFEVNKSFEALTEKNEKVDIVLLSECLVGDKFSVNAYELLLNADTLHLRLRIKLKENQVLKLLSINPEDKNTVDTDNL